MCALMSTNAVLAMDIQPYLTVLGISEGTSQEDIEARYRELADYFGTSSFPPALREWARQQAALVDEAYAVLLDRQDVAAERDLIASPQATKATRLSERARQPRSDDAKPVRTIRLRPLLFAFVMLAAMAGAIAMARAGVPGKEAAAADASQQASDAVPVDPKRAAELMKAVQDNPQNKDALFELGEMNFLATQWQSAIDWFTRLLAVDASNVHARTDVGTAQFNLGRTEEAKATWLAGLEIAPNDVQLNFNVGFLYANAEPQDMAAARKAWQKVIDVDPNSTLAKTAQAHMTGLVPSTPGSSK
jgi:tetratricopeptide (TPR) repeat protein